MGQILYGCARTTEAVRREIQNSQESLRTLAARHGVNLKTVAKWKKRDTVSDSPMGQNGPLQQFSRWSRKLLLWLFASIPYCHLMIAYMPYRSPSLT